MPDEEARKGLIENTFAKHTAASSKNSGLFSTISALLFSGKGSWAITKEEFGELIALTDGYSGSDLSAVCKEAAMGPVRELSSEMLRTVRSEDMRAINFQDFKTALEIIRPSVSSASLAVFAQWGSEFGASGK